MKSESNEWCIQSTQMSKILMMDFPTVSLAQGHLSFYTPTFHGQMKSGNNDTQDKPCLHNTTLFIVINELHGSNKFIKNIYL